MKKEGGAMIVPGLKYNISEEHINDYQVVSTLQIKSLNREDFAQYICVAKNTIGKSEETIKIYGNFDLKLQSSSLMSQLNCRDRKGNSHYRRSHN